jgi:hypothetical protein
VTGGWGGPSDGPDEPSQPPPGRASPSLAADGSHGLCDEQVRSLLREIDLLKRQVGQLWDDLADRDAQIAMLRDQVPS